MAPQSVARGALQSGDRAAAGLPDRAKVHVGANSPLRGRIFLWERLLRPPRSRPILPQPGWDGALRAACLVRLLAKGINHSRRRLSRIPSRKAAVAPTEICSALPMEALNKAVSFTGAQFNSHQPGYLSFSRLTNGSSN